MKLDPMLLSQDPAKKVIIPPARGAFAKKRNGTQRDIVEQAEFG